MTKVENLIKKIPGIGNNLSGIPTMISMLKCYITKEYQGTSLKTIAIIVSAFIYIVKENDIISDKRKLNPWILVQETHKPGGAWDKTYDCGKGNHKVISKQLIREENE